MPSYCRTNADLLLMCVLWQHCSMMNRHMITFIQENGGHFVEVLIYLGGNCLSSYACKRGITGPSMNPSITVGFPSQRGSHAELWYLFIVSLNRRSCDVNVTFPDNSTECGGTVDVSMRSSLFWSPGYDEYENYPNNANCEWKITAGEGWWCCFYLFFSFL